MCCCLYIRIRATFLYLLFDINFKEYSEVLAYVIIRKLVYSIEMSFNEELLADI